MTAIESRTITRCTFGENARIHLGDNIINYFRETYITNPFI